MRISDWSSDVCSSDLQRDVDRDDRKKGGELGHRQPVEHGENHREWESESRCVQHLIRTTRKGNHFGGEMPSGLGGWWPDDQKLGGEQAETISASSAPTLRKRFGSRLLK